MVVFNRAGWEEMSLAGSGLVFSPPPIPQDASLTESGIGIVPTPPIPQNVVPTGFFSDSFSIFHPPMGF